MISRPANVLLVVADCPASPGVGCVVALKSVPSGKLVYFAPCCGLAWLRPPLTGRLDEINSLADLGVITVTLPTEAELRSSAIDIVRTEPLEAWQADIPLRE